MNIWDTELTHLTLKQIIGDPEGMPYAPSIIPLKKSKWLAGVKTGLFPKPEKIKGKLHWKIEDIRMFVSECHLEDVRESWLRTYFQVYVAFQKAGNPRLAKLCAAEEVLMIEASLAIDMGSIDYESAVDRFKSLSNLFKGLHAMRKGNK